MARIQIDLRVKGQLSNDQARELAAGVRAFQEELARRGLELRGHGVDVEFDVEAQASVPAVDASRETLENAEPGASA